MGAAGAPNRPLPPSPGPDSSSPSTATLSDAGPDDLLLPLPRCAACRADPEVELLAGVFATVVRTGPELHWAADALRRLRDHATKVTAVLHPPGGPHAGRPGGRDPSLHQVLSFVYDHVLPATSERTPSYLLPQMPMIPPAGGLNDFCASLAHNQGGDGPDREPTASQQQRPQQQQHKHPLLPRPPPIPAPLPPLVASPAARARPPAPSRPSRTGPGLFGDGVPVSTHLPPLNAPVRPPQQPPPAERRPGPGEPLPAASGYSASARVYAPAFPRENGARSNAPPQSTMPADHRWPGGWG